MSKRTRLAIPAALTVAVLTGVDAGCGSSVVSMDSGTSDAGTFDVNSINNGDVIRLASGQICAFPAVLPDGGGTVCGPCYNPNGTLGDCQLCDDGPDGSAEPFC